MLWRWVPLWVQICQLANSLFYLLLGFRAIHDPNTKHVNCRHLLNDWSFSDWSIDAPINNISSGFSFLRQGLASDWTNYFVDYTAKLRFVDAKVVLLPLRSYIFLLMSWISFPGSRIVRTSQYRTARVHYQSLQTRSSSFLLFACNSGAAYPKLVQLVFVLSSCVILLQTAMGKTFYMLSNVFSLILLYFGCVCSTFTIYQLSLGFSLWLSDWYDMTFFSNRLAWLCGFSLWSWDYPT